MFSLLTLNKKIPAAILLEFSENKKHNVTNEMASYFSECSETKLHLMILSQAFFNFTFLGYLRKRLGQKSYYMKFLTDYYSYTLYIL